MDEGIRVAVLTDAAKEPREDESWDEFFARRDVARKKVLQEQDVSEDSSTSEQ
jgi:hypothetical protein